MSDGMSASAHHTDHPASLAARRHALRRRYRWLSAIEPHARPGITIAWPGSLPSTSHVTQNASTLITTRKTTDHVDAHQLVEANVPPRGHRAGGRDVLTAVLKIVDATRVGWVRARGAE